MTAHATQRKRTGHPNETIDIVAEMEQLLGEAQRELRSISYLAHPPLLRELGLAEALTTWFGPPAA